MENNQKQILRDIVSEISGIMDEPLGDITVGRHMISITSAHTGICTRINPFEPGNIELSFDLPSSTKELVSMLADPPDEFPEAVSYAMAAANSLLPLPEKVIFLKAQDLMLKYGEGKNAAVIGHFPFVDTTKSKFKKLWIFENNPRPGDLPAEDARDLLYDADVIAVTATTLLNGTCGDLLKSIRKDAFTIMLGPSTPFASCLFDWGIDALAGSLIRNPSLVNACIREGVSRRQLKGLDPVIWILEKERQMIF